MQYYIRQQKKFVSGPHDEAHIRQWIKEGKVREEMEFSEDGTEWMLGLEMYEFFTHEAPSVGTKPRRRPRRHV